MRTGILGASRDFDRSLAAHRPTTLSIPTADELADAVRRSTEFFDAFGCRSDALLGLRLDLQALSAKYPQVGAFEVVRDLMSLRTQALDLAGFLDGATRLEAMQLAAVSTGLLAKANHDMGQAAGASDLGAHAERFASLAGHAELASWCTTLRSFIAYWNGDAPSAELLAMKAVLSLGDLRTPTALWAHACLIRAHAARGNGGALMRALRTADEISPSLQASDLDDYFGLFAFSPARYQYYVADALAQLSGDEDAARERAMLALTTYESLPSHERSYSDEAGARIIIAQSLVLQGCEDDPLSWIEPVLLLPSERRIHGIKRTLHRAGVAVASCGQGGSHGMDLIAEVKRYCAEL